MAKHTCVPSSLSSPLSSPLLSSKRNTKEHGAPNASEQKELAGRRHKWRAALRQNAAGGGCSDRMLQPPASMAVVASRLSACLPVVPPSMATSASVQSRDPSIGPSSQLHLSIARNFLVSHLTAPQCSWASGDVAGVLLLISRHLATSLP